MAWRHATRGRRQPSQLRDEAEVILPSAQGCCPGEMQDLARLLRSGNVEQHRDVLERPQAAAALAGAPH